MKNPGKARGKTLGKTGGKTRGWCPSLYEPMQAGDGFLVRVKPPVAGLTAAQLRILTDFVVSCGFAVEITSRGNFQLRGVPAEKIYLFAAAMVQAGLANADPAVERRRNILVQLPVALELAQALEAWLETDAGLDALPGKFGFTVGGVGADISLLPGRVVLPGGYAAMTAEPLAAAQALTHAFLRLAGPDVTRMAQLIGIIGADEVFAAAGSQACQVPPADAAPQIGKLPGGFGLGARFGQFDGPLLRHAAGLAEAFGNGILRTGVRSLVLMGTDQNTGAIAKAAREAGFITAPDDVRLRILACAGAPACPQALADVRKLAADLAPLWAGGGVLHVSGCTKGCAAPGGAELTLVAAGDQKYAVVLDGTARQTPVAAGLSLDETVQWVRERRRCR